MAKKKKSESQEEKQSEQQILKEKEIAEDKPIFGNISFIFFGIGLLLLIAGYIALGYGSITLAPILLIGAYCVVIPIALLIKSGE
ncbi:MAG: hypothetical protein JXA60_05825 [Candidatus Coatesbacteria bacterium]|nr:hypothetical protein [Candidatus Coatesbacteria bacterium]